MIEELSLVHMVIIILFGLLLFFMLFIITKRQISRLTIRSARRPHINIGTGIPKSLQKEIQRRLHHVKNIKFEPTLLQKSSNDTENDMCSDSVDSNNNQKFRMKACDGFSVLEEEIVKHDIDNGERHPTETVRQYLYRLHTKGILTKVSLELIRNVVLLYENARHTPQPFEETEYNKFKENLHLIISQLSSDKSQDEFKHSPCLSCHRTNCTKAKCAGNISRNEKRTSWWYEVDDPATFPKQQRN
ncbi:Hypothetical predicted protein [Octopus vulgaris]|uniref:Uncharacterized protein n=2 Tax=Octopus vulgaris TaxID=6645 RepID=A0AA36AS01_OCTVU|nr:Hypothetical predicted protein [Octopus vulgaris]